MRMLLNRCMGMRVSALEVETARGPVRDPAQDQEVPQIIDQMAFTVMMDIEMNRVRTTRRKETTHIKDQDINTWIMGLIPIEERSTMEFLEMIMGGLERLPMTDQMGRIPNLIMMIARELIAINPSMLAQHIRHHQQSAHHLPPFKQFKVFKNQRDSSFHLSHLFYRDCLHFHSLAFQTYNLRQQLHRYTSLLQRPLFCLLHQTFLIYSNLTRNQHFASKA